jgi:hypothetical protein
MIDKMNKMVLFCSLCFLFSCAQAAENYPKDVSAFIENTGSCQHLAGEWDADISKHRQKDIERQVNVVCGKAKVEQNTLKKKYHADSALLDAINDYDF